LHLLGIEPHVLGCTAFILIDIAIVLTLPQVTYASDHLCKYVKKGVTTTEHTNVTDNTHTYVIINHVLLSEHTSIFVVHSIFDTSF
jgi:hypothetical protein